MFKYIYKRILLFSVIITLISSLIFVPAAEAKPQGGTTNTPPIITLGETGSLTINQNTEGTISLTAKDKDPMLWSISAAPGHGAVLIGQPTAGKGTNTVTISYTPNTDYTGSDNFIVKVTDNKGAWDTIAITVTIKSSQIISISYVALGDSIATGTVYPGKVITSYVTYFYEYLKTVNPQANVTKLSFATDGDRTNELYAKLYGGDPGLITAVENANVITVSIGGNNLMQAAKDSSALGGYNFNKIDTAVADQGLADFQAQWVPIIEKIKNLNGYAKVIVNTLYNPYNESDTVLHNTCDSYLFRNGQGLNDIILNNIGLGYSAANVYKWFNDNYKNNMGAVTYFYPSDIWGTLTRNPHPNTAGQNIITDLCKAVY